MTVPSASETACPQCLAQKRFAATYASPNEDVLCGFHTSELRKSYEAALAERTRERDELRELVELVLIRGKALEFPWWKEKARRALEAFKSKP